MRNSGFAVATALLASFVAVSQAGVTNEPFDGVASFSLIDPIIKGILEAMRPKLADIKLDDIRQTISDPRLNASIIATNLQAQNVDKYVIQGLKSTLLPLRLTNLTLTWAEINAGGSYDVNASLASAQDKIPINVFGKGKSTVSLKGVFFTIGANMEMKDNAIQVKPKGFFGFDLIIKKANVTVSSLMGSPELGNAFGTFISNALPDLVNALKKPVFDALHDDIVKFVNDILKKGPSVFGDEEPEIPLDELDLNEEIDSYFQQPDF